MKKIITYLLAFAMIFSLFVIPAQAAVSPIDIWKGLEVVSAIKDLYEIREDVRTYVKDKYFTDEYYEDFEFDESGRISGGGSTRGGGAGRYPLAYATGGVGEYGYVGDAISSGADNEQIYTGIGEGGATSYYQAIDIVNNVWYNPVIFNFSTITNLSYSISNDTYYIEDNEYNSYVIDNVNYISYYITETETGSTWYYEIYYQLPDGRYSYDLTAEEVWGTYFLYDAVNYDEVVEDDGTTLALLHFDGNILDSSAHNNDVAYTANASYNFVDSDFNSALSWSDSTAHAMTISLPEPLSGDFTIEGRINISENNYDSDYWYWPNGESLSSVDGFAMSDSEARSKVETRLGSGGAYDTSSTYFAWSYIVPGPITVVKTGKGVGVLFLDSDNLFKGDNSYKYTCPNVSGSWVTYYPPSAYLGAVGGDIRYSLFGDSTYDYRFYQTVGSVISFAFVRSGDTVTYYENGLSKYSFEYTEKDCETLTLKSTAKQSIVFDELRVSNKALYTDTYTPSSQPFDTNLVLVLPDQGELNQIAVKSNTAVADLRVGGVRPTYPSNGDVYVYLEEDVVKDVQQYQTDGWYSVDACIYEEDAGWTSFANYDISAYVSEAPEEDDDGSGSGGAGDSGNTGDGNGDSSGSGDLNLGTDGILGELISAVFGGVVSAITAALQGLLSIFTALIEFTTGFGSFLRSAFVFIPGEIISVITAGITLMVILAIIRFIRG